MKLQISFSACGKATAASLKQAMAYRYTEPGAACGPWHSSGVALSGDTKPGSSARIFFQDAYLKVVLYLEDEKSFASFATSAETFDCFLTTGGRETPSTVSDSSFEDAYLDAFDCFLTMEGRARGTMREAVYRSEESFDLLRCTLL
eukprot:gnl/TRDRNA2_/TRDRNA2_164156_c0_seq3.p2 gnl/TRDRNA2_/TRDRNA2_164156_c0~~gnl/TRDRNA2_/TRDRNA2_164156_c0_seq3.p2  ORF type:complete len:146 (+),score=14.38 gnl/TRDRNA2_/TRDRNA2_164156_c0_seq3:245-682(+)